MASDPSLYKFDNHQWTSGPQPVPDTTSDQLAGWAKFGVGVGAAGLIGRMKIKPDYRGFDLFADVARRFEEYSPGKIFRTFQVSHMLSSLETSSSASRYFSPRIINQIRGKVKSSTGGTQWLEQVSRLTGTPVRVLSEEGFRFEGGQLLLGKTGNKVILKHAGVMRSPTAAAPMFQQGYARSLAGGPLPDAEAGLIKKIKYLDSAGKLKEEAMMFHGGQTRLQGAKRFLFGYGTTLAERINQLARAPFELEPLATMMKKIPLINRLRLGVIPSSGLKTVAKITGKLGVLGSAAFVAYNELDYLARESEVLDNTVLGEGITAGIASVWTKANLAASKGADLLGLHSYREEQERIAPGSTSLGTLAAFPIMGGLAGLTVSYGQRVARQVGFRRAGLNISQASIAATAEDAFFRKSIYGKALPEDLLEMSDKRTLALVKEQTEKKLSGWQGKLAKGFARIQSKKSRLGGLARIFGQMSPTKTKAITGIAAGIAAILPFVPGALIPGDRPEDLEALYSGEKRVAIRKGRLWEFGRSPYEGQRIDRYQKHWYPRMLSRAKEKAIWGEDAPSPFERFIKENFTYELEEKHYKERPYPITGTAFEDVPFIGPLLAATIGKLIKPPKLMHEEDWMHGPMGEDGPETLRPHLRFGQNVIEGELEPGSPISPYSTKGVLGEQIYRMTEMVGLPGFTMTAIKESITGRSDTFDQEMQLESARRMYGVERDYWDRELGGGFGTTELVRRLYPHRRRQIELYNPIRNQMPEWLPGAGARSPDFLHGDPYTKVKLGEERLPGAGYAALNPDMEGVDPADYSAFHRFQILADVAPYTENFKKARMDVLRANKEGELSEQEQTRMNEIFEELKARKVRREFTRYQYKERANTPIEQILADANEAEKTEKPSWFERTIGRYWEELTHNAETPMEFLTPISPAHKLVHARTATEDYAINQVYGTENAFWGSPIRDFFRPFVDATKAALGWKGIPEHIQEKRDLEEYFDILKYVKYSGLKRQAQAADDEDAAKEYESKRRETLFGINPYSFNFSHIFRSLPRGDRDYFNEFIQADAEERQKIMEMIPENEQNLFIARWKLKDAANLKEATERGLLSEEQVAQSEKVIAEMFEERETEGMPKNQELWAEFLTTRLRGESYPDWYRRSKLLEERLDGRPLPGADWVGWHPAVDLNDIKLKIVENEGKSAYDYDLWPDRARQNARRPFMEGAEEELEGQMSATEVRERVMRILTANGVNSPRITVTPTTGSTSIDLRLENDRSSEVREMMRRGEFS